MLALSWTNSIVYEYYEIQGLIKFLNGFLDAHASLAPTHVCLSVGPSHFRISNLSASLVALRKKLKKRTPIISKFLVWVEFPEIGQGEGGEGVGQKKWKTTNYYL